MRDPDLHKLKMLIFMLDTLASELERWRDYAKRKQETVRELLDEYES